MSVPRRVVSTACSNTEIVCALGCAGRLVGVDDHSDFPPEVVGGLPRVGPDLGVDPERVAALEPDLVLASLTVPGHEQVVAGLEAAGLPVVALAPRCLDDVLRDVERVGELLGVPERAAEVVAELEAALAPRPAPAGGRPVVAVEWWPKPSIVPGRRSWVTDLLERAGGSNPLGDEEHESRPVSDEEMLRLAPDALVLAWCGVDSSKVTTDTIYAKEVWREMPAVRRRQVVAIPEAFLGRPSPRLAEGMRALRRVVEEAAAAREREGVGSGAPGAGPPQPS